VPVFLYDDADPDRRPLPDARRDAFDARSPDRGPHLPHPTVGAVAVGARPPMVAVNCWLDRDDVALARAVAAAVRERDAGLLGVRALGLRLAERGVAEVSMNLVDLDRTGVEAACMEVRRRVDAAGARVTKVEIVGLVPAAELDRCSPAFLRWAGLGPDLTIEHRLATRAGS
jgi:glutamate formiminotransferase / 5-formyltetrahydrofolate cyclo-ligase